MSGRHVIIINNALAPFDPNTEEGQANRANCTPAQLTEIDRLRGVDSSYVHTPQDKAFVSGITNQGIFGD
jgi:hypothetical protein